MAHELAEHEDRRFDVERETVVLERRAVAVAHEVVDEALVAIGGIGAHDALGLFPLGRDPRGKDDIGIGSL